MEDDRRHLISISERSNSERLYKVIELEPTALYSLRVRQEGEMEPPNPKPLFVVRADIIEELPIRREKLKVGTTLS